jgi:hypothetical protein
MRLPDQIQTLVAHAHPVNSTQIRVNSERPQLFS